MASGADQLTASTPVPPGSAGHLALYRAWRPQRFGDVVGQEHVTRTLRNALAAGRVGHAYLFSGPRGTGKTSVAKILARAVNCLEPASGEPCDRCEPCRSIAGGRSLDVLEIDAASHRGIEEIRDLREKVKYSPAACRTKVYIIDEVHMLTSEAFNALLKTLEEPPTHALFILATTEAHKIPVTILSRCQRFDFHRLGEREIVGRLREVCGALGVEAEDAALFEMARRAEGGLRDALSLLDQCLAFAGDRLTREHLRELLGTAEEALLSALADALADGDAAALLGWVDRLDREGKDLRQVVQDLIALHRDLLFIKVTPADGAGGDAAEWRRATLGEQAVRLTLPHLLRALEGLARLESDLRWSTQPRLTLEVGLLGIAMDPRPPRPAKGDGSPAGAPPELAAAPAPAPREASPRAVSRPARVAGSATALPAPPAVPPDPGAPPAASTPVAPASAAAPVGDLQATWRAVIERIKKQRRALSALLEPARPVALDGNRLVLAFGPKWDFHREGVAKPSNRSFIEQILREVVGAPVVLRCILDAQPPGDDHVPEAGEPALVPNPAAKAALASDAFAPAGPLPAPPEAQAPEPPGALDGTAPDGGADDPLLQGALALFGGEIIELDRGKASGEE